uniref:Uncharacterized protein n=1 Tax=Panagrolaimus superbus TaxID=310955 RepID=A0A914Y7D0_9BILA
MLVKLLEYITGEGKTNGSEVVEIRGSHTHSGDAIASERCARRNAGRALATSNPQLATRRVIAQVTAPTSDALRTEGTRNLERMIRHQRQLVRLEPPVPRTADFEIPNELQTMSTIQIFLNISV